MPPVQPIPEGFTRVTPHLVVDGAAKAIDFYKKAFGAEEIFRAPAPDGRIMHAELRVGDAVMFLNDDFPEWSGKASSPKALGGSPIKLHQYVRDCDAAYNQAVQAGAAPKMPPADMFWGDRYAGVTDPFGHEWTFATHVRDVSPAEMEQATQAMFGKGCQ